MAIYLTKRKNFSESRDLAASKPEKPARLKAQWIQVAEKLSYPSLIKALEHISSGDENA